MQDNLVKLRALVNMKTILINVLQLELDKARDRIRNLESKLQEKEHAEPRHE